MSDDDEISNRLEADDREELLFVLRQIESIAAVAGLRGEVDEEEGVFRMGFETAGNRSQRVTVRYSGFGIDGKRVITIASPACRLLDTTGGALSRERLIDLLMRNERMLFARYGIFRDAEGLWIVASSDLSVETLDAEEFRLHAYCVANAADNLERLIGSDIH